MAKHYDELHNLDTAASRVVVRDENGGQSFAVQVTCAATGQLLGSVSRCGSIERAVNHGKRIARENTY